MRVGERAALGTVVEAFYSPFPACNYRLAKALCPENCLSHLTATAQIASEGEGGRAECVRGSSAAKNDLGQPARTCAACGSARFGWQRAELPPRQ